MHLPRIDGYAIVSADGMIATAEGIVPSGLLIKADQAFFHRAVEAAGAIVHGRNSHEQHPPSAHHRRIILTRSVPAMARDPDNDRALLWNPAGARFEEVWRALGIDGGTLAVIGGTSVFGMFLPRYDAFHLSRAAHVQLPGGRPVFPHGPAQSPEQALERHGLRPTQHRVLDQAAGLTLTTWEAMHRPVL